MSDYYLENLDSMSKKNIALYVAQHDIKIPKIFENLKEAKNSGLAILIRVEHKQNYNGLHRLFVAPQVKDYASVTEEEIQKIIFQQTPPIFLDQYCKLLGKNLEHFKQEVSFSLWEKLEGYNRAVFADSAIRGRYHIYTRATANYFFNYTIFDNDKLTSYCVELPQELKDDVKNLVELYEKVRTLDRFDKNHCPLIEIQTVVASGKAENYFLQYHKVRDFEEATFVLDRKPKKNENEALLVRGATPPEGMTCKATMMYKNILSGENLKLPESEVASFDTPAPYVFNEIMLRRRVLQVLHAESVEEFMGKTLMQYDNSKMFKPGISLVYRVGFLKTTVKDLRKTLKTALKQGQNQYTDLYVISDGRKAYIKTDG